MPMDKETLTARDALDACLDALVTVAASATPGPDGTLDDGAWAAMQHVLDLAEDPEALARGLGGPVRESIDVPLRGQDTAFGCGAASLQAALSCYGVDAAEPELARALGTDPGAGTHPRSLLGVARSLGLQATDAHGMTLPQLSEATTHHPVICCVQMHGGGHWVVVSGVDAAGVHFMDPADGRQKVIPGPQWEAIWHDRAADGGEYIRYGITIGPPVPS
jgi:hypothetical protein